MYSSKSIEEGPPSSSPGSRDDEAIEDAPNGRSSAPRLRASSRCSGVRPSGGYVDENTYSVGIMATGPAGGESDDSGADEEGGGGGGLGDPGAVDLAVDGSPNRC